MRTGLSCGAGFPAGLGALCRLPLFRPIASSVGADQRVRPWSKPPGLPCRRSRRQSHTIPSCAGVPTPSSPHGCALHFNPRPPLWGRLSSRPGRPSPTAPLPSNRLFCRGGPACPPLEHAARLATPASPWSTQSCVPHRQFSWSKPPGLPCRRSRRQSHTIPSCARVPTPSSPHGCALHFDPPPLWGRLSSLRPAFQPAWAPFADCPSSVQSPLL